MSRWVRDRDEYERGEKWFCDWHRAQQDDDAKLINIDGYGYCPACFRGLYFVEATKSRRRKYAIVTETLAHDLGIDMLVFYRDDEHHPDEILVDHRSAEINHGWIPESQAWEILQSIRCTHICARAVQH